MSRHGPLPLRYQLIVLAAVLLALLGLVLIPKGQADWLGI
jgi:hypothetical protein